MRAESGWPGGEDGRKQGVRRRTGKRRRGRETPIPRPPPPPPPSSSAVSAREEWRREGRRRGGADIIHLLEVCEGCVSFHVSVIKAFNGHIHAIKKAFNAVKQQKSHSGNPESM